MGIFFQVFESIPVILTHYNEKEPSCSLLSFKGSLSDILAHLQNIDTGKSRGWQTFSVKDQTVNIVGFAGHTVCRSYSTLIL